MMRGIEVLETCRERLRDIRRLNGELEELRQPDCALCATPVQAEKEKELREARFGYIRAMAGGIEALGGMPDSQRAVLWRAYMLGMSNTQIACALHYARRSVLRLKKSGIEWMRRQEEERGDEQGKRA